mmetsp:Transcript_68580/g.143024  ORF Transcript_68580/g.143024 Transcript_68580/m.143024 type:complete len:312 (-) Transcript_68580:375-1310(-)
MIFSRCSFICFEQPSAICEMHDSAACRYFQSWCSRKAGTRSSRKARLKTVFPPSDSANRSRQSLPTSREDSSVSSSSSSAVEFHSTMSTSSTTSISCNASGTMFCRKVVCLRIMVGACSASVTSSSTARKRVSSSKFCAVTIWMAIWIIGSMCLRKNLGASSAIEMNSSIAVRAASSSGSFSAAVRMLTIAGIMSVRLAMCCSNFESACTMHAVALSADSLTSFTGSCSAVPSSSFRLPRLPTIFSLATNVSRENMSIELSRNVAVGLLAASNMKGMISGQSPAPMIIAAISPVVSAILRRTALSCSCCTA